MFTRNNLILLRFHFSLFLLPVFLFAISQIEDINTINAWIMFSVLHLLVYPASNGYNSFMDRDETSIGGLKNPPKADIGLFYLTIFLDVLACIISLIVGWEALVFIIAYIFASRAYSYRGIRLKKYPVVGFLTVAFFQGAFTYFTTYYSSSNLPILENHIWAMIASSLLIGGIYPMTQIYQHEADFKDGVVTLSYLLGYVGTFILCAISFTVAMACMFIHFSLKNSLNSFFVIQVLLLPVIVFFLYWFVLVYKDITKANFENTMKMNLISSVCLNVCFLYLIIKQ
ncbi:MAG: UbiA prenyltransferase family protein [Opitutaceae bacterium]|nr:UbiA prenyltransferase family protein [Cytophagales bacterium]